MDRAFVLWAAFKKASGETEVNTRFKKLVFLRISVNQGLEYFTHTDDPKESTPPNKKKGHCLRSLFVGEKYRRPFNGSFSRRNEMDSPDLH